MELILKKTVDNLGEEGDVVTVKPGFGRNYLLPQGVAVLANTSNLAILEKERAVIEARKASMKAEADSIAKKVSGVTVIMEQRAGEDDKLFGSVTSADIAEKLASLGIEIDRKKIVLPDAIKTLGEFMVKIKIGYQVTTEVKVQVVPLVEEEKE